jgi:hypothetical protein
MRTALLRLLTAAYGTKWWCRDAPFSAAVGGISGLVMLDVSFVDDDPKSARH